MEISKKAALLSNYVTDSLSDETDEDTPEVIVPNVDSKTLKKVVAFLTHYDQKPHVPLTVPFKSNHLSEVLGGDEWYLNFCNVDKEEVFAMINAANFMNIRPMLELACIKAVFLFRSMSEDEIGSLIDYKNLGEELRKIAKQETS